MNKKFVLTITLLTINLIIYFFLLPYTQKTANSHINAGPIFGIILYLISTSIIIYSTIKYYRKKELIETLIVILIALSLIYWGIQLRSLFCEGCMNSG
jgi:hypothetical protein